MLAIFDHPSFARDPGLIYDLSLLKESVRLVLLMGAAFSLGSLIKPAVLPTQMPKAGAEVIVVDWGRTRTWPDIEYPDMVCCLHS